MAKPRKRRTALQIEREHPALQVLEPRERKFVLAYLTHGQRSRAASEAGYAGEGGHTAGRRLMARPRIQTALAEMRREIHAAEIAEPRECLAHLSEIVRDPESTARDRIAASTTIMKAMGAIGPDAVAVVDARTQTQITIGADAPLHMLDALALLARVAAGEQVAAEEAQKVLDAIS